MEHLLAPFSYGFMQRAFAAAIVIGALCPVLGVFVVLRRLAFIGDGIAHASFLGIVVAYLRGLDYHLGAAIVGVATALGISRLQRSGRVSSDTAVGILFTGAFALGVSLMSRGRGANVDLQDFLFGNILGVSDVDLALDVGLAALAALVLAAFYRKLLFATFDPSVARVAGVRVEALEALLLALLALVIVVAIASVGIVLVASLLVTPAATALRITRRFSRALAIAGAIGMICAIAGLYLSFYLGAASGSTIVLLATLAFFAVGGAQRARRSLAARAT